MVLGPDWLLFVATLVLGVICFVIMLILIAVTLIFR